MKKTLLYGRSWYKFLIFVVSTVTMLFAAAATVGATDCNTNCEGHFSSVLQAPDLARCVAERALACKNVHPVVLGACGSAKWQRLLVRDSWGDAQFGPACETHDTCYGTLGKSKDECDRQFGSAMRQECKDTYASQFHVVQRNACLRIADVYHSAVSNLGAEAYRDAQKKAPQSGAKKAPYGLVCLVNRTDWIINYDYRWGDGEWQSQKVTPNGHRYYWWTYSPGSQSSPDFRIKFDMDFTSNNTYKTYNLKRYATSEQACWSGKVYEFKKVGSSSKLDLYDAGN